MTATEKDDKAERLAAALRENLRRRKAQARSAERERPRADPSPTEAYSPFITKALSLLPSGSRK